MFKILCFQANKVLIRCYIYIPIVASKDHNLVVIELKVSRVYERTVGQLLRYRAWVRENLADGRKVRSVIIAKTIGQDLKPATSEIQDIDVFENELKLDLKKV